MDPRRELAGMFAEVDRAKLGEGNAAEGGDCVYP